MTFDVASDVRQSALVDYVIPAGFDEGESCSEEVMSDEQILRTIALAKSNFSDWQAKSEISFPIDFIKEQQIVAAKLSYGISKPLSSFISSCKAKGLALDVGCGIGLNSIALLTRGWDVYALDLHKEVLDEFEARVSVVERSETFGKYKVINKDVTKINLKNSLLDLVLAYDVLSYLDPDALIPTIKKIYAALLPGGIFMGSLLANREVGIDEDIVLMASVCALNAYSYTDPCVIANIFRYAGFHIELCMFKPLMGLSYPARIVSFVARKLSM